MSTAPVHVGPRPTHRRRNFTEHKHISLHFLTAQTFQKAGPVLPPHAMPACSPSCFLLGDGMIPTRCKPRKSFLSHIVFSRYLVAAAFGVTNTSQKAGTGTGSADSHISENQSRRRVCHHKPLRPCSQLDYFVI